MAQEFTERQERKIDIAIQDLTGSGHFSVGGPFWTDVIGNAHSKLSEIEFRAEQFRNAGNEPVAASLDEKGVIAREVLRRLVAMS